MTGGRAKKAAKAESKLRDLMAKAHQRGDKLKKTLTRIAAQTELDPGHPAHTLLKALDKSLGKLRAQGEAEEQPNGPAKAAKRKADGAPARSASSTKSHGAAKAARPARAKRIKTLEPTGPLEAEAPATS